MSDETAAAPIGPVYAIVVKYSKFNLGEDFLDLLTSLRDSGVNAIVVCNGRMSDASHALLTQYAHRILVRDNVGRDMGAYRAATLYLHDQGLRPGRLLYFNDSVLYLKGKPLDGLVGRLSGSKYDVVGVFENHQHDHHVGSYVFSVSGNVFVDPQFQLFWRKYRPYDLRPHAIHRGEIALSRLLKRSGYGIDVVYSAERLADRLFAMTLVELTSLVRFMRPVYRMQPLKDLMARSLAARSLTGAIADREAKNAVVLPTTPTIGRYAAHHSSLRNATKATETAGEVTETLARHALIDSLMMEVTQGSQIHFGFGLYHRLLDSPIIKKDLLARSIYLEHDCVMILDRLPEETRATIMREIVSRGRPLAVRGVRRFLLQYGLI